MKQIMKLPLPTSISHICPSESLPHFMEGEGKDVAGWGQPTTMTDLG